MSLQRRRGQAAIVYQLMDIVDARGNIIRTIDMGNPMVIRAAFIPIATGRVGSEGNQTSATVRMICDPNLADVDTWGRVLYDGREWDITAPPMRHNGSRHVRHWSVDLAERTGGA